MNPNMGELVQRIEVARRELAESVARLKDRHISKSGKKYHRRKAIMLQGLLKTLEQQKGS